MADGLKLDDLQIDIVVNASKASSALKDLSDSFKNVGSASKALKEAGKNVESLGKASDKAQKQTSKMNDAMEDTGKSSEKAADGVKKAGDAAEKSSGKFQNFVHSIGRIAMYRAIRTAIKTVTQAVSEGFNMFVSWDREQNNSMAGAAAQVDKLSQSWTMLKGQIGALGGALANTFIPIITRIVDGLTKMVDLLQMVIRSLQGEYSYYKLIYHEAKATTGAAKELKRVLFGFDELNILPSQGGGGVTSSAGNWAYELVPIESSFLNWIADASNKIKEFFGISDEGQNILGGLAGVLGLLIGGKALGGLLGLLPKLITGFKQKNTSLADQTSKVTQDATATQGLATNLGLALGAATLFSQFLKKNPLQLNIPKPEVDFSKAYQQVAQAQNKLNSNPVKVNVATPSVSFSNLYQQTSAAQNKLNSNPVAINFKSVADLSAFSQIASGLSVMQSVLSANPLTIAMSAPLAVMAQSLVTFRNTMQTLFNTNPLKIAMKVGNSGVVGSGNTVTSSGVSNANAGVTSSKLTVADVEKEIRDAQLMYESDLWNQGGNLGKIVGVGGLAALVTALTGGISGAGLASILKGLGLSAILGFADGGIFPNTGSLFVAGENHGAEIVANLGSHTGVMNVNQMQEAVASGNIEVINAIYGMANMVVNAVNSKNFDIYMDASKVGHSVTNYQNNQARRGIAQGAY